MKEKEELERLIANLPVEVSLKILAKAFPNEVALSTSFGYEDQVISHVIFSNDIPVEVFTLDTGRLFAETYSVWNATLDRYKKPIKAYYPKEETVQKLVSTKGPNSFYESIENRKECCFIRKVEPLKRALHGKKIWVTGIRAEQSANRKTLSQIEWDETNKIYKYHPLLNWKLEEVKAFIKKYNIPYNPLHDRGFVSIGWRTVYPGNQGRRRFPCRTLVVGEQ